MADPTRHPSAAVLAAYVTGELCGPAAHRFELHVARCSDCARRLQAEAAFEVALHDAADAIQPPPRPRSSSRWRNGLAIHGVGALATAASVLLTLGGPPLHVDVDAANVRQTRDAAGAHVAATTDGDLLACVPALDDFACNETPPAPTLVASAERQGPDPWTELPEPFDPAMCWADDEGSELVCTGEPRSG